jgi:hypothetical protein
MTEHNNETIKIQTFGDANTWALFERSGEVIGVEAERLSDIFWKNRGEFLASSDPFAVLREQLQQGRDVIQLNLMELGDLREILRELVEYVRTRFPGEPPTFTAEVRRLDPSPPDDQATRPQDQATQPTRIRIRDDSGSETEPALSPDLVTLLRRAGRFNQDRPVGRDHDISFGSLLLALSTGGDPASRRFRDFIGQHPGLFSKILERTGIGPDQFEHPAKEELRPLEGDLVLRRTERARGLMTAADELRQQAGGGKATSDVPWLLGAVIYRPGAYEPELYAGTEPGAKGKSSLEIPRRELAIAFLDFISFRHRSELRFWSSLHSQVLGEPAPEFPEGPLAYLATDRWTTADSLGYRAYAHAIALFLTQPATLPPLTISIQAPWGGGKTSLMRMIQDLLDPWALQQVEEESSLPRGQLKIKDVLEELRLWAVSDKERDLPKPKASTTPAEVRETPSGRPAAAPNRPGGGSDQADHTTIGRRMTIWFNAWKYQSTNQVWSGLADAIMQQVAARLPLRERERFWLNLNVRRLDADRVRQRVYEQVLRRWWQGGRLLAIVLALFALPPLFLMLWAVGHLGELANWPQVFPSAMGLGATAGGLAAAVKYLLDGMQVHSEPAALSLNDYLEVPDYRKELGYIHQVEADLRRVLACVDGANRPLVIFIDDLDRCSPAKVAEVIEAVNLFLAGDLPDCMFVLGIDAELVAAALQVAHKELIAQLPREASIPIGWRFMDKFVQLPFLIPPSGTGVVSEFTRSLFTEVGMQPVPRPKDPLASQTEPRDATGGTAAPQGSTGQSPDSTPRTIPPRRPESRPWEEVRRILEDGVKGFTDENDEVRGLVAKAATNFRGNPRELKRFVNAFRFQFYLWWARRAQGLPSPNLDQVVRWTVVMMRWPEAVRWIGRGRAASSRDVSAPSTAPGQPVGSMQRLAALENFAAESLDLKTWLETAPALLQIDSREASWLGDGLYEFFHFEGQQVPAGQRLSSGSGLGLW